MNKILIITPTYNEIANIKLFVDTILSTNETFHMLVVDDSSPDGTGDLVKSHQDFGNRLFLLSRPGKMGLGSAYCEGFRWALSKDYSKIIQIDADFSHNPKYLPEMNILMFFY